MGLKKLLTYISVFLSSTVPSYAVTVVQQPTFEEPVNSTMRTAVLWIFGSLYVF